MTVIIQERVLTVVGGSRRFLERLRIFTKENVRLLVVFVLAKDSVSDGVVNTVCKVALLKETCVQGAIYLTKQEIGAMLIFENGIVGRDD